MVRGHTHYSAFTLKNITRVDVQILPKFHTFLYKESHGNGKVVPVLNYLSSTLWRRMVEWRIVPSLLTSPIDGSA
jgi:hypothetical protein